MDALLLARMISSDNSVTAKAVHSIRRKSVSFPLTRPSYFAVESTKKVTTRKGVHFPVSVLLQQAITEGDLTEISELLQKYGNVAVEEREPSGLPPVLRAIFEEKLDCLKMLVNAGADLTVCDPEGWTALHVAAAMDDIEAARYIVQSCNNPLTQIRNADNERPIDLAESPEMARFLLQVDLKDLRIETELPGKWRDATEDAILSTTRHHYENNADCDYLNVILQNQTQFDTLLHLAASHNYARLAYYILKHQIVDRDCRDRKGWTPLHIAAYHGSVDVTLLLVEYGASIHALSNSYERATDLAQHELILDILREEEKFEYI